MILNARDIQCRPIGLVYLHMLIVLTLVLPSPSLAAPARLSAVHASFVTTAPASNSGLNLDLSSTARSLSSQLLNLTKTINIFIGGAKLSVTANSLLTPAELVAASQVEATGVQMLTLSTNGNAIGGRFSLTGALAQSLTNLVIPQNVKLLENFGNTPSLTLSGNLTDAGTFIAFSSTSQTVATISADNIYVEAGGLLTTNAANAAAGHAITSVRRAAIDLNLNALNDIVNYGTISSSANLNLSATGAITNSSISSSSSAQLQAKASINLQAAAGAITNSGTIIATTGSINLNTADTSDLVVNNSSGTMQALQGNINARASNYTGNANIYLTGGNWFSQELNLNGGQGTVAANFNQVTGTVNVTAGQVNVQAASNNLLLGNMNISGDPTYYNTAGDVTLSGSLIFSGQDLAIIANQDIVSTGSLSIDTSNAQGNGGNILFVAGAGNYNGGPFTVTNPDGSTGAASANNDTTTAITLQGQSSTGGLIDLAQSGGLTSITTASKGGNGNGGNITMIAYTGAGSGQPPLLPAGSITLPATSLITSSGNGTGANGNILIIAGAGQAEPPLPMFQVITLGGITAVGGTGGGGNVTIAAAEPSTTGPNGYVQIINGTVQAGSDTYLYSNVFAGSVTIGSSTAGISANQLKVVAGGNLAINGQVTANGGISLTTYGNGILTGGQAGSLNSTGPIAISLGTTATTTIATTSGQITINQGGSSLVIGTQPSNIASLSIATGNNITVGNSLNIGGANSGVLTLDTTANNPYSNNIFLNGSVTANGGVNLIVAGTGIISASNGCLINSTGPISLTLGVANASLSAVSGNIVVSQAASSVVIAQAGQVSSLTVNFGGNISVATPLTIGGANSGSLTFYAQSGSGTAVIAGNGNIILANNITANGGISLTTGGTGTIGGTGGLYSTGPLMLSFGTAAMAADITIAANQAGNITINQANSQVVIGTEASAITSLTVTAPVDISTTSSLTVGGANSGTLSLNSSTGNLALTGIVTANGGITLSASGTIVGSANSTAGVVVNYLTSSGSATTLSAADTSFSISDGGQTLSINNTTAALTINSADNISLTTAIIVNGSLSLNSMTAGNTIDYGANNITANGGITLTASGQGTVGGASGSLNTSGAVTLNLGTGPVSLSAAGPAITVSQGGSIVTVNNSNLASLSINASGEIASASDIGIGAGNSGSLSLASSAAGVVLNNVVTANGGITLAVSGANTVGGAGTLSSAGTLTVNLGGSGSSSLNTQVGTLATASSGASLTITQSGAITLYTNNLGAGSLSLSASGPINVAATITAGNISLQASASIIGGAGQLNSQGNISICQGANLALCLSGNNLQISNGTSQLTVAGINNLSSLAITSSDTVTTTNAIAINGSLSLESLSTNSGASIVLNASLTANGGITMSTNGQATIEGSATNSINSTGPITINLAAAGQATLSVAAGNITVSQGASVLTIGTATDTISSLSISSPDAIAIANSITIGSTSTGFLALASTTAGNNISLGANSLTANAGIDLTTSGTGTISATTGTINSTGSITLNLGTPDVKLSASGENISINQGGESVTIGTQASLLNSLSVAAAGNIIVSSPLTVGGANAGSLSLTSLAGSISLNNNITANTGISLSVNGPGTISGSGNLSTQGNVSLTFGSLPVTINTSQQSPIVTAGGLTATISNFATLAINSDADITIGSTLNFPTQSFSFTSAGNIALNNNITAANLTLQITGAGTIGGQGTIASSNTLTVNLGSNTATLTSPNGNLVISDNSQSITTTSDALLFSLTAPEVVVNSGITISVPSLFYLHTNTLSDSGTILQNYALGWIQIDNTGLEGSLTLTNAGTGSATIENTTPSGATINILDFNGQSININSSYTIVPNDGTTNFGIVRIWEATYSTTYPNNIDSNVAFSTTSANYANIIVNPDSGQINFSPNVTVSGGTYFILSAPTMVIGAGAVIATSSAEIILLHTSNLIDNSVSADGSVSSITTSVPDGFIQIDDQGMNPSLGLIISGAGTAATPAWFSNTSEDGGPIAIIDYHGQQVNFSASTTINAGVNCDDVSGAWQEIVGGDAMPVAGQEGLESSPTSGSIVLAPNVTVTAICGAEVEFDAPTQIYNQGSQFIDTGVPSQANQMTLEVIHLTNNGQLIDQVPNSLLGIVNDDDATPSPADADIEGPIQIFGSGTVSATGAGGTITVTTEGPGQPSIIDPIVFYGNQTFSAAASTYIFFQANRNIAFANYTTQAITSGNLVFDAPMTTNNGVVTVSGGGTIYLQNSSFTTEQTLVTNNGVISNSLAASSLLGINILGSASTIGNIDTTVAGTGSFITAGSNISITSPVATTLTIAGSPTFNAGSGSVTFSSGNSKLPITFGDGNATTITIEGAGVNLTAGKVTLDNLVSLNLTATASSAAGGVVFKTPAVSVLSGNTATLTITTYDPAKSGLGTGTTINVGSGTVSLLPVGTTELIVVGGYGGNFSVPATALSAITAGNVIIGNAASAAGITLGGSYTMPKSGTAGFTAGLYNLDLENNGAGGTFSGNGYSLNVASQDLTITVGSTIDTGSGKFTGTSGSIDMAVTASGNGLTIGDGGIAETAGGNISLSTTGGGAISGTGVITSSGLLTLDSQSGNIGSASANLRLSVSNLVIDSQANVYLTDNSSLTISSPSTAASFLLSDTATNGSITLNSTLAAANSLTLQSGTGGNINLNGNLSANTITINAGGSGAVTQASGLIAGNTVVLVSNTGNLGTESQVLNVSTTAGLSANTSASGSIYLSASTPLLYNSSSGTDFQISNTGSLTVNNIYSANGGITVIVNTGTLKVNAGASLNAVNGNLTLQNKNANQGKIFIDSAVTIQAAANTSCNVSIFLGTAPPPQNQGNTPENVTASTSGGGQIFFGSNGLVANPGNNFVYAAGDGANIVFDTGNEGSSAITLNGGTTIYANSHQFTPLTSLDLTNKATVALISNLQGQGLIGGQLTVVNGVAVGGTLVLEGGQLGTLTAMNIPSNVQVTLNDFQSFNAIDIDLSSHSTSRQVVINGQELFTGAPSTSAIVNIDSALSGTVFTSGTASLIDTTGALALNANGSITIGGSLTGDVNLATTANNGRITLNSNIGLAGNLLNMSLNGSGSLSQAAGKTITAATLTISSSTGSIGSISKSIATAVSSMLTLNTGGTGSIYDTNSEDVELMSSQAGSNFSLTTTAGLTVNNVDTINGTISLKTTGGVLQVNNGATLLSRGGNITLQNTNTATGSIVIGTDATLDATATSSGKGIVSAYLGTTAPALITGPTPDNVTVNRTAGGQVYFGSAGITATAPNNQINAYGRNVIFSTGNAAATQINLDGGVTITADPPTNYPIDYCRNENNGNAFVDTGDCETNDN